MAATTSKVRLTPQEEHEARTAIRVGLGDAALFSFRCAFCDSRQKLSATELEATAWRNPHVDTCPLRAEGEAENPSSDWLNWMARQGAA